MQNDLSQSQQLILKLTTYPEFLLIPLQKYCEFFNYLNSTFPQSRFYLELIKDGIIVVFKDKETFDHVWIPFSSELIEKAHKITRPNFIISGVLKKYSFPEKGIIFYLEPVNIPIDTVFSPIQNFFSSLASEIQITIRDSKILELHFKTLNSIKIYTNILELLSQYPEYRRFST